MINLHTREIKSSLEIFIDILKMDRGGAGAQFVMACLLNGFSKSRKSVIFIKE